MKTPSADEMIANLVMDGAKWAKDGFKLSKNTKKRLAICNACEFFDKEAARCLKCGCFMNAKVYMDSASCPLGKWGAKERVLPEGSI